MLTLEQYRIVCLETFKTQGRIQDLLLESLDQMVESHSLAQTMSPLCFLLRSEQEAQSLAFPLPALSTWSRADPTLLLGIGPCSW